MLQEGFSNVELLVLPHEPTHSILREEWEKEREEQQLFLERQQLLASDAALPDTSKAGRRSDLRLQMDDDSEWWNAAWFRRLGVALAGLLVLASIAGSVQVVVRMDPDRRAWGWALLCVSIPLLLPAAITVHWAAHNVLRVLDFSSDRYGAVVIVSSGTGGGRDGGGKATGGTSASAQSDGGTEYGPFGYCEDVDDLLDAGACDDDQDRAAQAAAAAAAAVATTGKGTDFRSIHSFGRRGGGSGRTMAEGSNASPDESAGCYFIRLPLAKGSRRKREKRAGVGGTGWAILPALGGLTREKKANADRCNDHNFQQHIIERERSATSASSVSSMSEPETM
jgi:hypothetical protein